MKNKEEEEEKKKKKKKSLEIEQRAQSKVVGRSGLDLFLLRTIREGRHTKSVV